MKEITISQIIKIAEKLSKLKKKWHYHILTPECQLNDEGNYALVLENLTDNKSFICRSDLPYMDVGKQLVKLLHGDEVVKGDNQETKATKPTRQVQEILKRAKQLNSAGKSWHHHMLFPGCEFNKYADKWVIVFEDKEARETIESISDNEPKSDLQHIETLFYKQKKAE